MPNSSTPDVAAVSAEADILTDFFNYNEMLEQFLSNLSMENILMQLAVIFAAVLLGFVFSRRFNRRMIAWRKVTGGVDEFNLAEDASTMLKGGFDRREVIEAIGPRARRLTSGFLCNISFSLFSGLLLALGAWVLVKMGFEPGSLVLCRVAYSALLAYALLCCILSVVGVMIGDKGLSKNARRAVSVAFWILVALEIFGVLEDLVRLMESTKVPLGGGSVTIWTCVVAVFTVLFTLGIANWAANLVERIVKGSASLSPNLQVAVTRVIRVGFFVIAVITGLSTVGIDLTVLSVFGGAVGVGLGFGLQKICSNYISGFIILLDRSVKIGDLVEVANFRGRITQINTRFTVVRNNDGVECVVPNENFVTSPVLNHSYTEEASVQYISISVAYNADIKRALEIMLEEGMRDRPRIVKNRRGWSYLESFGDSGINLKLGFWVADPVNGVASLKTAISTAILERFNAEGIEVPYNRLELNIRQVQAGTIPVRIEAEGPKTESTEQGS